MITIAIIIIAKTITIIIIIMIIIITIIIMIKKMDKREKQDCHILLPKSNEIK